METKEKFSRFAIVLSEHLDILSKNADRVLFQVEDGVQALECTVDGLHHVVYLCALLRGSARSWAIASVHRSLLGIAHFREQVRLKIETAANCDWLTLRQPFPYNFRLNLGGVAQEELHMLFSLWAGMRIRILKRALCLKRQKGVAVTALAA